MKTAIVRMHSQNSRRLRFALTVQLKHLFDNCYALLDSKETGNVTA
jgi:hypothetical protein